MLQRYKETERFPLQRGSWGMLNCGSGWPAIESGITVQLVDGKAVPLTLYDWHKIESCLLPQLEYWCTADRQLEWGTKVMGRKQHGQQKGRQIFGNRSFWERETRGEEWIQGLGVREWKLKALSWAWMAFSRCSITLCLLKMGLR